MDDEEGGDYETEYELREPRFVDDEKGGEGGYDEKMVKGGARKGVQDDIIFLDDEMHDDGVSVFSMQSGGKPVILFPEDVKVKPREQLGDIGIKRRSKAGIHKNWGGEDTSNSELFSPVRRGEGEGDRKISSDFSLCSSGEGGSTIVNPLKIAPVVKAEYDQL